jgi:hypothetical protein
VVSHLLLSQGFHRLDENATYGLGQRFFETYRYKPFGLGEPKCWICREKGCDVSVVVVGLARLTA